MSTLASRKENIVSKLVLIVASVVASVALPQVFHYLGIAFDLGSGLGEIFLPMHLPVLIVAFIGGPIVGAIVGTVSPLLSFALSGMPGVAMLPFIVIELATYGLVAGLLGNTKLSPLFSVLLAQLLGRGIKAIAIVVAVFGFGNNAVAIPVIWNSILVGIPGIVLQLALVPVVVGIFEKRRNEH